MNKREFNAALLAAGLGALSLSAAPARAQSGPPVEGKDFLRLEPAQPPRTPGKIEVLEFFSYACPHCNAFEPTLQAWVKKLPADVTFRRVPVPFLMNADNFQHTYYALETIGVLEAMQPKIFAAVHVDRLRLDKPEDIAALVTKNGGDGAKFLAAFKSFSVSTAATRATALTGAYKIDGVPTLAIQGHYLTSPSQAGNAERALAVADYLIDRARKA
ncbi:MAG: thiol:disulfide interchange protein DsbA/DsbL [Caldimonas sp.]